MTGAVGEEKSFLRIEQVYQVWHIYGSEGGMMMSANGLINLLYTDCQGFLLEIEQQFHEVLNVVVVKSVNLVDNSLKSGPR